MTAETRRLRVAAGTLVVLALVTALVFLRGAGGGGYELRGLFANASQLSPGSDVRTAGARVGEVRRIEDGPGHTALVTMAIDDTARPVGDGATLAIEPRLVLEGNGYVRLEPGAPGEDELASGATIPLTRTSGPTQLDQVLTTFDLPTRTSLHNATAAFAEGLAGDGFRSSVRALDRWLPAFERLARESRGSRRGALGFALRSTRDVSAQLVRDPVALAELVTNYERVVGALADSDRDLAATLRGFSETLRAAPPALTALDGALPSLTRIGDRLRPALSVAPRSLAQLDGLLTELDGLIGDRELPALVRDLRPISQRLPELEDGLTELLPQALAVTECLRGRIVPVLKSRIEDGANTTGDPVYLDMAHGFTGATGAAPSFDGNGVNVRAGVTEGASALGGVIPGLSGFFAGGPEIEGVRPAWLGYGVEPAYRPDQPCTEQPLADLTKRANGAPPTARDWADLRRSLR